MSNENSAEAQMNQFVDIVSFVHLFINLAEIVVHQSEEVSSKFIQLVNAYLGVEDSLKSEKRENEIIENHFFLARNHRLILTAFTPWTSQVAPHKGESR
jgi:predicted transcriptional regulator YheO